MFTSLLYYIFVLFIDKRREERMREENMYESFTCSDFVVQLIAMEQ